MVGYIFPNLFLLFFIFQALLSAWLGYLTLHYEHSRYDAYISTQFNPV